MRHRWTKLSLLAAGALMVPASLGVMAFPGLASAVTPGPATCSAISLKVVKTSATLNLSKCTDTANTGGAGTIKATTLVGKGAQTVVITWASGGTTTTSLTVFKGEKDKDATGKACSTAKGHSEYEATGTVKSDTGKGSSIKVGGKVSAELCAVGVTVTLEPGTVFTV